MNGEDINKMWLQSQDDAEGMRLGFTTQQHYFAALVAAAEREACAKVCEQEADGISSEWDCCHETLQDTAAAIRARGNP